MNKTDITLSIGTVAKIVGIPKYKLRNWCDRYLTHISKIEIGNTQHRRFREEDIQIIKRIDQLMKDGHTLKSAAEKSIKQYKEK
jgi:DNA-binding transcriptional MerR regulator